MNNLKRTMAFIFAMAVCINIAGCSEIPKSDDTNNNSSLVSDISETDSQNENNKKSTSTEISADDVHEYKPEPLSMPDDSTRIGFANLLGDGNILMYAYGMENNNQKVYNYDKNADKYNEINIEFPEGFNDNYENSAVFAPLDDGSMYAFITTVTHGDMGTMPLEYDENFDYEAYYNSAEYSYSFAYFDKNGKLISNTPVEWIEEYDNQNFGVMANNLIYIDDDTLIMTIADGNIFKINTKCEKISEIKISNDYVGTASVFKDRDNNLLCMYEKTNEQNMCDLYIAEMDIENDTIKNDILKIKNDEIRGMILKGNGKYKLFISMVDGLFGVTDDNKKELIIDWLDSSINQNLSSVIFANDDGSFLLTEENQDWTEQKLYRYIKKDPSEIKEKKIITIGSWSQDSSLDAMILEFNKYHDDIQAKYDFIESDEQLRLDLISGNAPDVIINGDISTIQSLQKKGVFASIYDFMDNEENPEFKKDAFLENVLQACESNDGNLYMLPVEFDVRTFMIKSKFFDKQNCTYDNFINLYKNPPIDDSTIRQAITKKEMFNHLFNDSSDFVDYEKAECHFDSPEFIEILEFCNEFPKENLIIPDKWNEPEAFSRYYTDVALWYRNDKDLFSYSGFYNFNMYNYEKYGTFNEDMILAGIPSINGDGGKLSIKDNISIINNSENKNDAWEFVKMYIESKNNDYAFPVYKKKFDKMGEDSMKPQELNTYYKALGEDATIPPLSAEEVDFVKNYIYGLHSISNCYNMNVLDICNEEVNAFFEGGQSAKDTADYIQSRVSILLSEQS